MANAYGFLKVLTTQWPMLRSTGSLKDKKIVRTPHVLMVLIIYEYIEINIYIYIFKKKKYIYIYVCI